MGEDFDGVDGWDEQVVVAKSVDDAVPHLSVGDDGGGGGRIDGLGVSFDDDDHDGDWGFDFQS